MAWTQANPSTFVHAPAALGGKLILQKLGGTPQYYLFQATTANEPKLEVSGSRNRTLNDRLTQLYLTIERQRDTSGLEFLKRFIPK
jgi:hypothetical protein